jgi:hypothetical protein
MNRFPRGFRVVDRLVSIRPMNCSFAAIFARNCSAWDSMESCGEGAGEGPPPFPSAGGHGAVGAVVRGVEPPMVERPGLPAAGGVFRKSRTRPRYFSGIEDGSSVKWRTPDSSSQR